MIDKHVNDCIDASSVNNRGEGFSKTTSKIVDMTQSKEPISSKKSNMFSVLMSGHRENQAWKEATVAEDRSFRPTKANGGRRKAPFYKVEQERQAIGCLLIPNSYEGNARNAYRCRCFSLWQDPRSNSIFFKSCSFGPLYESIISLAKWPYLLLKQVQRLSERLKR